MYECINVIYGKVLTKTELERYEKKYLIEERINGRHGALLYNGSNDTVSAYVGICLSSSSAYETHGKSINTFAAMIPGPEDQVKVEGIFAELQDIFDGSNTKPEVQFCWSTS